MYGTLYLKENNIQEPVITTRVWCTYAVCERYKKKEIHNPGLGQMATFSFLYKIFYPVVKHLQNFKLLNINFRY